MVPNSVLHPTPKNHWEYCYIAFSHIGLCSLVSLLPPSALTNKSLLLFLTFCLKLYHYLIIFRLICRDTRHVHGGKEGRKSWWQPMKARCGSFAAGSWMRQQRGSICSDKDVSRTSWILSLSSHALPGGFSQEVSFFACRGVWRGRFSSGKNNGPNETCLGKQYNNSIKEKKLVGILRMDFFHSTPGFVHE